MIFVELGKEEIFFILAFLTLYMSHTCMHKHTLTNYLTRTVTAIPYTPSLTRISTHTHKHSPVILPYIHSNTHTLSHFFWMIKNEESDHTIMWEMCFSDIIEIDKNVS